MQLVECSFWVGNKQESSVPPRIPPWSKGFIRAENDVQMWRDVSVKCFIFL